MRSLQFVLVLLLFTTALLVGAFNQLTRNSANFRSIASTSLLFCQSGSRGNKFDSAVTLKRKAGSLRSRLIKKSPSKDESTTVPIIGHEPNESNSSSNQQQQQQQQKGTSRPEITASAIVDTQPIPYSAEAASDAEAAAIEQAMHNLFMRQVGLAVGAAAATEDEEDGIDLDELLMQQAYSSSGSNSNSNAVSIGNVQVIPSRMKVETPTAIEPNSVVELLYKKRIAFGNVVERKSPSEDQLLKNPSLQKSSSLVVRLSTGLEVTVDVGQIISVWDLVADEQIPIGKISWAQVATEALGELKRMSPRKSDLSEFWQLVSVLRSKTLAVDSMDVGVYIFQESKFKSWVDPYSADGTLSRVHALSAAQRYAAALILHSDSCHFKRQQSRFVDTAAVGDADTDVQSNNSIDSSGGSDGDWVIEGGYKVLDASLVAFKECESFEAYYRTLKQTDNNNGNNNNNNNSDNNDSSSDSSSSSSSSRSDEMSKSATAFRASCVTRQLRMLELYALSNSHSSSSSRNKGNAAAPKAVKMLLKRLQLPLNPLGARQALLDMGHSSSIAQEQRFQPRFRSDIDSSNSISDGSSNSSSISGVVLSPAALAAAAQAQIKQSSSQRSLEALDGYAVNITPWPEDVLTAAQKLRADCENHRKRLSQSVLSIPSSGKLGPSGRLDFRATAAANPAICIDQRKAEFFDDAFSLSPKTGELLIHVTDAMNFLRKYESLQSISKERIMSTFLPSGPLHMLPPQALESLKLSTTAPNEVLTVALKVDYSSGEILQSRVFPATIGPVIPIDIDTANEMISGIGVSEVPRSDGGEGKEIISTRPGYRNEVVSQLLQAHRLLLVVLQRQPWIAAGQRSRTFADFRVDKRTGTVQPARFSSSSIGSSVIGSRGSSSSGIGSSGSDDDSSNSSSGSTSGGGSYEMLNTMLTLYSNVAHDYCLRSGLNVPVVWDNRDRSSSDRIRRFATQPLRNWIAQLQQHQLRAAFKMELPLLRKDCAMAVAHHNSKRKLHASAVSGSVTHQQKQQLLFEAFENHCAMLQQSGGTLSPVVLMAEATGNGGAVHFPAFGVPGIVQESVQLLKGQRVLVEVVAVLPSTRSIKLKLAQ